ncbi:MAG TPA: carboxypeptidase-like regulatory domain-containing protein, partial [Chitinophagales bacterium]|nr:carboxypeptidase-like regulatory domain-containing protein [Chitinophagales bacterium]
MMRTLTISAILLLVVFTTHAQINIVVKGKITDYKNNPVPNVSISQLGTHNGTTSNTKGFYAIDVTYEDSCVIEFSGVEYLKKTIIIYPTN